MNRIANIQSRVRTGLGEHATASSSKKRSVQLADRLALVHDDLEAAGLTNLENVEDIGQAFGHIDTDTLRRLRKITEIIEDDLSIDVGHRKLARAASTGAKLSSVGAFIIAGHNLLISADSLDRAYEQTGSIQKIGEQRFHDFYRAICVFLAEGFLLTTAFNFKFAWRGTRYLNNRYLYWLRGLDRNLHRLVLSEIHYVIRGIVPAALRSPEEFLTYLTSMAVQTIELLRKFSETSVTDLPGKIEEVVHEYISFVDEAYEIATPDVNIQAVIQDVLAEFSGLFNYSSNSLGQDPMD